MLIIVLAVFIIIFPSVSSQNKGQDPDMIPDYEIVFPENKIQVINITISPESWNNMQSDMTSKYGEFGYHNTGGPGGMNIPPVSNMPGGNRTMDEENIIPGGDDRPKMMMNEDPIYVPANISFNGETWEHVGIRYKGFNSLTTAWQSGIGKISLKIDMDHYEEDFPETKNQKLYGFKTLNLQAGTSDKSVIREKIVPEIFQDTGVPAPETAFYRVFLDHGDGMEYFGLYTVVESVDDTLIKTQFINSSGNLYKPEGEGATFSDGNLDLSAFEKQTNKKEADYSDIEKLYTILHSNTRNTSPETWRSDLESIFNVDEFITWLAANTLISNWDTYGGNSRNYYLYNDPDTGKFNWIPWDNNYALMNNSGGPGMGPDGMNSSRPFPGNMPPGGMNITMPGMNKGEGPGMMGPDGINSSRPFPGNMPPGGMNITMPDMNKREGPGMMGPDGMNSSQPFPGNMPPGGMNITMPGMNRGNGPGMGPGGMGSSVSFSMENVTDSWPLIRYLMDDPVYHEKYLNTLKKVAEESFNPEKIEKKFDRYHDLIESSVIGPDGERTGYTYLSSDSDFQAAYDELKALIRSQYAEAIKFLQSEDAV